MLASALIPVEEGKCLIRCLSDDAGVGCIVFESRGRSLWITVQNASAIDRQIKPLVRIECYRIGPINSAVVHTFRDGAFRSDHSGTMLLLDNGSHLTAMTFDRLREGRPESIETTSLHLDVLRDLRRIHSHICSVAYPVLDAAGELAAYRSTEADVAALSAPATGHSS